VILWCKIKGASTGLFGGAIFVDGVDSVKNQVVRVCVEKFCVCCYVKVRHFAAFSETTILFPSFLPHSTISESAFYTSS
jgi:hypothetical protein